MQNNDRFKEKQLKVENNESSSNLKIQVLLTDYQLRVEEILRQIDNQNRAIQVFLTGTFLLIAYSITSEKYLLFLPIPFILFVLFHHVIFGLRGIYNDVERCKEIERKVGKLLGDDRLLCWEREYGGKSERWKKSKGYLVNYTLVGCIGFCYLLFSILACHFIPEEIKNSQLASNMRWIFALAFIVLAIIGFYNAWNVFRGGPTNQKRVKKKE